MKFHIKKPWMESIRHLDTYFVIFLNHIQSSHVFFFFFFLDN